TGELAVGEYVATVTATNSAGSSTATGTVTIQAVVLAPAVTINPLTAAAGTVTITGTISDPAADLTLTINDGTHTPEIDGNDWSLQITLSAGEYPTTITAENAGGSDSDSVTVVVEAVPLNVTMRPITSLTLAGTVNYPDATVAVTASNGVASYDYTGTNNGGAWSATVTDALTEGAWAITVTATLGAETDTASRTASINADGEVEIGGVGRIGFIKSIMRPMVRSIRESIRA